MATIGGGRGRHTTFIDFAAKAVKLIGKKIPDATFSAGRITSGIDAKSRKISLSPMPGFVVMTVIMGHTKQEVRVFSADPNVLFKLLRSEYQGGAIVQINQ